jgi:hypothetical protein
MVPIFTRILDFKRDLLARLRNKRSHPRHRVGANFPLKAVITLSGDDSPVPPGGRARGCDWSGRVGDISNNGLNVMLPLAASAARGEATTLRLTLENHVLEIPATVAHFRVYNTHALCGLRLAFADYKTQKAYHQLVEAVSLGASFAPAGPGRASPGFVRRSWRSKNKALLIDWREADSRALDHFELTLGDHSVQGRRNRLGLEVQHRAETGKAVAPVVEGEVRQLFRWVVGNLPKSVPADLREFMTRIASSPPAPPPPRTAAAPVVPTDPSSWLPPKGRPPGRSG